MNVPKVWLWRLHFSDPHSGTHAVWPQNVVSHSEHSFKAPRRLALMCFPPSPGTSLCRTLCPRAQDGGQLPSPLPASIADLPECIRVRGQEVFPPLGAFSEMPLTFGTSTDFPRNRTRAKHQ